VIGIKISTGNFLVAFPTLVHDAELERRDVGPGDGMGGVAIVAVRKFRHSAHPPLFIVGVSLIGMDVLELFKDPVVTTPAGADNVFADQLRGRRGAVPCGRVASVQVAVTVGHGQEPVVNAPV
jgi:hypothetical protein